jgi:hypothetical protein
VDCICTHFEMSVSSARRLGYFSGVCSNLAPISFSLFFPYSKHTTFYSRFLNQNLTTGPEFLQSSWMPLFLGPVFSGNSRRNFFSLSSGTISHTQFVEKSTLFNSVPNQIDTQWPVLNATEDTVALVSQ